MRKDETRRNETSRKTTQAPRKMCIRDRSDALKIGQEITAKVVDFNEEDKKISLSMKALENEEPVEE